MSSKQFQKTAHPNEKTAMPIYWFVSLLSHTLGWPKVPINSPFFLF